MGGCRFRSGSIQKSPAPGSSTLTHLAMTRVGGCQGGCRGCGSADRSCFPFQPGSHMDARTWGWTLLPYFSMRVDSTCNFQDSRGPSFSMAQLLPASSPVSGVSVETDKRCHLCCEDALHVGQGGSASPLGSLLRRARNSVLGLEGGIQAGFSWVLEVKRSILVNREPLLYWHGGGKRSGTL